LQKSGDRTNFQHNNFNQLQNINEAAAYEIPLLSQICSTLGVIKDMAIKFVSAAFFILFAGCNSGQDTKTIQDRTITKDTTKQIKQATIKVNDNANHTNLPKHVGIWTDGSSENATFDIRKDSIYYVDQFVPYKYSLRGDSIKIFYPDWTFTGAVSFSKDTMIIASEDGTTKYWKFKE
jgi:hypothetical protein